MLPISSLKGFRIAATDGDVGTISDVLFDDKSWMIRWIEIDTGTWLSGRKVLLPPTVLGHPDLDQQSYPVRLTRAEVEASPETSTHKPVSRQFEMAVYDYYGWSPYWGMGFYPGPYGITEAALSLGTDPEVQRRADDLARHAEETEDSHLHSAVALKGYHIHASDGEIGHLTDFLIEEEDFSIHYMVVDTSNWWMGKRVLISPRKTESIRWTEQMIYLNMNRERVQKSPEYDPAKRLTRDDKRRLAAQDAANDPNNAAKP